MRVKYLPQDLNQRLHGGIAFYDGKPVMVSIGGDSGTSIFITSFPKEGELVEIDENDEKFDISSPALGWVNGKTRCLYVYRRPERKYKQTLSQSSVSFFNPLKNANDQNTFEDFVDNNSMFFSEAFKNMLLNEYPSNEEVFKALDAGKVKSRAINRDVAITVDSFGIARVYFKTEVVGVIRVDERVVDVPHSEHSWIISKYLSEFNWRVN